MLHVLFWLGLVPCGASVEASPSHPPNTSAQATGQVEVIEERYADGTPKLRREVRRDRDGVVNHGLFQTWHPNGQLERTGRAVDGRWEGAVLEYWINGKLKEESEYKLGVRHGKHNVYWKEGDPKLLEHPKLLENYKDGRLHGRFEDYHFGPGRKAKEGSYVDGKQDGPWKEYDVTGPVLAEGVFKLGVKDGLWIYRNADGKKTSEETYRAGALDGVAREFAPSGALIAEAHYKAGKSEGLRAEWYESGGKKSENEYAGGLPNGRSTSWFENGNKQLEGEMKDGKRNGRWTYWNPDGTVNAAWSGLYENDKRIGD